MKNLLRLLAASFLLAIAATVFGQLPIGTKRIPITTDGTNAFDPPLIIFTNDVRVSKAPTVSNQVARLADVQSATANAVTNNQSSVNFGVVTVSNVSLTYPQWIDVPMNYSYSVTGPDAPALVAVSGGSPIYLLGFDNTDVLYATAQLPHNLAVTNANNATLYMEPHVHFTVKDAPAGANSNVTWRVIWQFANIGSAFGTSAITNTLTMGVASSNVNYLAELGHITNNSMNISGIFRCRIDRPASALNDYGNAQNVLLNSADVHVQIGNFNLLGSRTDNAP